jgi:hypothetical protein
MFLGEEVLTSLECKTCKFLAADKEVLIHHFVDKHKRLDVSCHPCSLLIETSIATLFEKLTLINFNKKTTTLLELYLDLITRYFSFLFYRLCISKSAYCPI